MVNQSRDLFQQDNARQQTAKLTKETFKQTDRDVILPHPLYSLHTAPRDSGIFCSVAHFLHNQRFSTFDEVKEDSLQLFFLFKASGIVSGTDSDASKS